MNVSCSLTQTLAAGEIWTMQFGFELSEPERIPAMRDELRSLYEEIASILHEVAALAAQEGPC
jgi:hypothetical protein